MNKEIEMLELENGVKLAIIDAINYQDHIYILTSKLNETLDDIEDEKLVYEKIDDKIVIIEDNDLLEKLINFFKNRLTKIN